MKRFISIFFAHKVLFARKKFFVYVPFWKKYRVCFTRFPSGRLPRFARNDIKCVARKRIKKVRKFCNKFPSNKLLYSVRSTMSLRGAKRRGNLPEGNHFKSHARYFVLAGKRSTRAKEWALSLAIMWFQKRSYRGPRGILCTRGEKEYASIRQPTAACDNRLVKREAYDASPGRDTVL